MGTRPPALRFRVAATALLLCTACATGVEHFGVPLPADRIAGIQPSVSTRAEVLALLGPPTYQSPLPGSGGGDLPTVATRPGEERMLWEYRERREVFGTILIYTYFSQRTLTDTLLVILDEAGVVSHVAFGSQTGRRE